MIDVVEKPNARNGAATVIKLAVTWAGKDALEKIAAAYGMKEQEAAGRIYEWFVAQDDITQRAVMGLLKGLEVDAARRFMERLAEQAEPVEGFVSGALGAKAPPPTKEDLPVKKKPKRPERNGRP